MIYKFMLRPLRAFFSFTFVSIYKITANESDPITVMSVVIAMVLDRAAEVPCRGVTSLLLPLPALRSLLSALAVVDGVLTLLVLFVVGALMLPLVLAGGGAVVAEPDWSKILFVLFLGAVGARVLAGRSIGGLEGGLVVVMGSGLGNGLGTKVGHALGAGLGAVVVGTEVGTVVVGAKLGAGLGCATGCGRTTSSILGDVPPVGLSGTVVTGGAVVEMMGAGTAGTGSGGGSAAPPSTAGPDNSVKPLS